MRWAKTYRVFSNEDLDASWLRDEIVVYLKDENRYVRTTPTKETGDIPWKTIRYKTRWFLPAIVAFFVVTSAALPIATHVTSPPNNKVEVNVALVLASLFLYSAIQVAVHELSHILALRAFGEKHDRIGARLEYNFLPTIYVRINRVLLLPREQRCMVHLAGVAANAIINTMVFTSTFHFAPNGVLFQVSTVYSIALAINVLPFLNTDGYRALITMLNVGDTKQSTQSLPYRIIKVSSIFFFLCYAVYTVIIVESNLELHI